MQISRDIWGCIILFMKGNNDKCKLLMTCKEISKCNVTFDDPINIEQIYKSRWFHYFTNVNNVTDILLLPKNIIKLGFSENFVNNLISRIPKSVIQLTFSNGNFIGDEFPETVTHLCFRHKKRIISIGNFPKSVSHLMVSEIIYCKNMVANNLILNHDFCGELYNSVPRSVSSLTLHEDFNNYVQNCIPSTVKEVTIIGNPSEERLQYIQQFIPENCKLLIRSDY